MALMQHLDKLVFVDIGYPYIQDFHDKHDEHDEHRIDPFTLVH